MAKEEDRQKFRSIFGQTLSAQLKQRGMTQTDLSLKTGRSVALFNQRIRGDKTVSPKWVDFVADVISASEDERLDLHEAAAISKGYKIRQKKSPPKL